MRLTTSPSNIEAGIRVQDEEESGGGEASGRAPAPSEPLNHHQPPPPPPPPLRRSCSRLSLLNVLGVVSTYRADVERLRLYYATISIVRFIFMLNLAYMLLGGIFILLAFYSKTAPEITDIQRNQFFRIGLMVSIVAQVCALVDCMALKGLRTWRRALLIPWLIIYAIFMSLFFSSNLSEIWHKGLNWKSLIILICLFLCYSIWRQVRRMYSEMAYDKPTCRTIEELTAEIRAREGTTTSVSISVSPTGTTASSNVTSVSPPNDLPPKYEDLEQPPQYVDINKKPDDSPNSTSSS